MHTADSQCCCWVQAAARKLFPLHHVLLLQPNTTSSLQLVMQAALRRLTKPAVLVVLIPRINGKGSSDNSSSISRSGTRLHGALVVDELLTVDPGQSLVLATPNALMKAAAASSASINAGTTGPGPEVPLLSVHCKLSTGLGLLKAR